MCTLGPEPKLGIVDQEGSMYPLYASPRRTQRGLQGIMDFIDVPFGAEEKSPSQAGKLHSTGVM